MTVNPGGHGGVPFCSMQSEYSDCTAGTHAPPFAHPAPAWTLSAQTCPVSAMGGLVTVPFGWHVPGVYGAGVSCCFASEVGLTATPAPAITWHAPPLLGTALDA
jgi:hypothetical protein